VTEREAVVKAGLGEERRDKLACAMIAAGKHAADYQIAIAIALRVARLPMPRDEQRRPEVLHLGAEFPEETAEERHIKTYLSPRKRIAFREFLEAAILEKMDHEQAMEIACELTGHDRDSFVNGSHDMPKPTHAGMHRLRLKAATQPAISTSPPVSPVATQQELSEALEQAKLERTIHQRNKVLLSVKTRAFNSKTSKPATHTGTPGPKSATSEADNFSVSTMDSKEWSANLASRMAMLPDISDLADTREVIHMAASQPSLGPPGEPTQDQVVISTAKVSENRQAFTVWKESQPPQCSSPQHFEEACITIRPQARQLNAWRAHARQANQTPKEKTPLPSIAETAGVGAPITPRKSKAPASARKGTTKRPRHEGTAAPQGSWPRGKKVRAFALLRMLKAGTLPIRFFCQEQIDTQPYIGGQPEVENTLYAWANNPNFDNIIRLAANAVTGSQERINPRTTSIEAPPGSGKSTLLRYLKAHKECGFDSVTYKEEPLQEFSHVFKKLVEGSMTAPQAQTVILNTQLPYTDQLVVTDRGTGISSLPFILMNYFTDVCSEEEAKDQLQLLERTAGAPASMLFLCMPTRDTFNNVQNRQGQAGDEGISILYCVRAAAAHALSMALMHTFADNTLVRCIATRKHTLGTAHQAVQPLMANVAALVAETNNQAARTGAVDEAGINNAKDVAVARHFQGGNLHDSMRLVHIIMQGETNIPIFLPVRDGEAPDTLALRLARIAEQATRGITWPKTAAEYVVIETCPQDGMPPRPSRISSNMRASDDGFVYDAFTSTGLHASQPEPDFGAGSHARAPQSAAPPAHHPPLDQGVPSADTRGMAANHATAELDVSTSQAQAAQELRGRIAAESMTAAQLMEELRKNPALVLAGGTSELDLDASGTPLHPSIPRPCQAITSVMLCEHFSKQISATERILQGEAEEDASTSSLAPIRNLAEYVEASDRLDTWATATGKFTPLESADHRGYTREIRRLCSIYEFKNVLQYDHLYRELKHIGEIANWHTNRPELHLRVLLPGLKHRGQDTRRQPTGKHNRVNTRSGQTRNRHRERPTAQGRQGHQDNQGQRAACNEFARTGRCRRGASCKFAHITPQGKPPKTANKSNIQRTVKK
jgi:hypothetical protein